MTINSIATILIILLALIFIGAALYFYLRDKSLNDIRADVYQLFLKAEHDPELMESGKKKMKWVLNMARSLLPGWAQIIITDTFLERIVEGWFQAVKDLLDDGKLNGSEKESEE